MEPSPIIALFGEAEKGVFGKGTLCSTLPELEESFGQPPPETSGLYIAVQSLLFNYKLIFFRVRDEGFSLDDYLRGFSILSQSELIQHVLAIGLPGVGNHKVLEAADPICQIYHPILITTEKDFFDLISSR